MSGCCHRTHVAERDVAELASYLGEQDPAVAIRFLDAVEATVALLAEVPDMGLLCQFDSPKAEGLRVWPVRGFKNHLVFYREIPGGISIIRVLHGARNIERLVGERRE